MMPSIGFGVFQIPVNETERIVTDALEAGYRLIDTAASYFNEEQVGNALRAFDLSMKKLGLDYLDLYLLHKPYGNYYAAWRAAERLYREGRIRAIGVTSFSNERLQDLFLHNEVKPAVNQLETHPFFQQKGIGPVLAEHGTRMMAWGPLGGEGADGVVKNGVLASIGEGYGKTAAQVALRWLTQRGIVAIPKSTHVERMRQNLDIFDFTLSEEEMRKISTLNQHDAGTVNFSDPQFVKYLIETYG